jgi:predicted HicB family RNase H-like nuclease
MNKKELDATYRMYYGHRLKAFSLRLEPELKEAIRAEAKKNGNTLTAEISKRLEESLL